MKEIFKSFKTKTEKDREKKQKTFEYIYLLYNSHRVSILFFCLARLNMLQKIGGNYSLKKLEIKYYRHKLGEGLVVRVKIVG